MRGLVMDQRTLKLPLLRAAAFVLVSGSNDLCNGGAADNNSAPQRTSEVDPTPVMDLMNPEIPLGTDSGTAFIAHQTLTSWFSPDVISTVTGQPSGSKRGHSTDEGKFCMKKPRCSTPHEPWTFSNTAASSEDRPLEDVFAAMETSATNYCQAPTAQAHQHIGPTDFASISSAPLQRSFSMVKHREDAACSSTWSGGLRRVPFGETVATETREYDTSSRGAAPVPAAEINAAQPPDTKGAKHISLIRDAQSIPSQSHQAVSKRPIAEALRTPINPVKRTLRDLLLARASDRATSTSHSGPSYNEGLTLQQILEPLLRNKEWRSSIYHAAKKLLLSPEGAKGVLTSFLEDSRRHPKMADAPYLSPAWLLERLVRYNKTPSYLIELKNAFECYGYDNVSVPDVKRKALDLAYTLSRLGKTSVSDPKHLKLQGELVLFALAAEIIHDAFFNGRPLRPDLKTYLRNRLKVENAGKYQLQPPRQEGDLRFECNLCIIRKVMKPEESINHPLDFVTFFDDIYTLVRCDPRKTVKVSSAANKNQRWGRDAAAEFRKVIPIVTKYKKLFNFDLAVEVEALLRAPPDSGGFELFQSAIEKGYIPFDLLRSETVSPYTGNAHCVLGSLTALYRRLFESIDKANDVGKAPTTSSDSDASDPHATDGKSESNVVQEYLLQPLLIKGAGASKVKKYDPLLAASEALELWRQELDGLSGMRSIPSDIIRQLRRLHAPFGSSQWILTQLIQEHYQRKDRGRRNELQFALDLCGYRNIDIKDLFARAFNLAATILKHREVPFNEAMKQLSLCKEFQNYALAADIIHAALFRTWPQHQDLIEYCAKHIRYEVLPQHTECLKEVLAKRDEWHPNMTIRHRKGVKTVVNDWWRLRNAKILTLKNVNDDHPLSFDCFWNDVALIYEGNSPAIPAIASKYRVLFNRDIVGDLKCIRETAPQICYSNSFLKGVGEGYVPYRYAELLTVPRKGTLIVNNNALLLLGAIIDCYMSLVGPADATAPKGTSAEEGSMSTQEFQISEPVLSGNEEEPEQHHKPIRPEVEEQMAQLMAILRQAPAQKPPTAKAVVTKPAELNHVSKYLLGRSQMDVA